MFDLFWAKLILAWVVAGLLIAAGVTLLKSLFENMIF